MEIHHYKAVKLKYSLKEKFCNLQFSKSRPLLNWKDSFKVALRSIKIKDLQSVNWWRLPMQKESNMKHSLTKTLKLILQAIAQLSIPLAKWVQEVKISTNLIFLKRLLMILQCLFCIIVGSCIKLLKKSSHKYCHSFS